LLQHLCSAAILQTGTSKGACFIASQDTAPFISTQDENIDTVVHPQALDDYSYVVDRHGDLALAEYARIGRALLLYQVRRAPASSLPLPLVFDLLIARLKYPRQKKHPQEGTSLGHP
jgi:hypothetical protein